MDRFTTIFLYVLLVFFAAQSVGILFFYEWFKYPFFLPTGITEEYVMDGQTNQGGAVSNSRSWLDQPPGLTNDQAKEMKEYRKSEACIKAIGSAEGTGRIVGTSVGASAAPALTNIPYIGWVAAGWVSMFGGNQVADIGGNMAENLNKNC